MVQRFESNWEFLKEGRKLRGQEIDSSSKPSRRSLHKNKYFNLSISERPINFDTSHFILNNPYFTDDFDDYDDNFINYPVSYSVIYDEKLISLFRNGKFVCHSLQLLERERHFEERLNTKKFKYHWVIDNNLYALSGNRIYKWENYNWIKSETDIPISDQPVIFSDSEFIVFGDCHGEWGGTVYFFDRVSKE
ncbi:MAG: hypothetical protein RIF46_03225, partial [Cyclobacteriaceae bacterium]